MQNIRQRAHRYVDKAETSSERVNREDQVMVGVGSAIIVSILAVVTIWIGGRGVLYAWLITFAALTALVWALQMARVTVTV